MMPLPNEDSRDVIAAIEEVISFIEKSGGCGECDDRKILVREIRRKFGLEAA